MVISSETKTHNMRGFGGTIKKIKNALEKKNKG